MKRVDFNACNPPSYKLARARLLATATLLLGLIGCDIHKAELKCEDSIEAYDKQRFEGHTDELGSAVDPTTGITWYRCPAGKRFVNYVCRGDTLRLSWDESLAFAREFSEKSGVVWRLPTKKEMKSINKYH